MKEFSSIFHEEVIMYEQIYDPGKKKRATDSMKRLKAEKDKDDEYSKGWNGPYKTKKYADGTTKQVADKSSIEHKIYVS